MVGNRISRLISVVVAGSLLSACAASQPKETTRYFWPRLPERPRIEWIKNYANEADMPKGGVRQLFTDVLGEEDTINLDRALDIVVNSKQQVFIADAGSHNVVVFDFVTNKVRMLPRIDKEADRLQQPVSLALGENEQLYVGDMGTKKIAIFSANGAYQRSFPVQPNMDSVGGMAVDLINKQLFVADTRGHKIGIFDLTGKFKSSFGTRGDKDGEFSYPIPLRLNGKNELVVGDTMNARIQVFDTKGKFLRKFGSRGDAPQDFQVLKGIGIDSENNIYITDGKAHKVVIYNNDGDFLLTFGGLYSSATAGKESMGGFVLPQGLFIDKTDRIYVVDQMNHRFQVFQYLSDGYIKLNPIKGYDPNVKPVVSGKE